MSLPSLSVGQLIERLTAQADGDEPCLLAFDADGTLWRGDVGEEAFVAACHAGLLKEEALPNLRREAARFSVDPAGSASELGLRLLAAYKQGLFPELEICELMVWGYAGWTRSDVRAFMSATLASQPRSDLVAPVWEVANWAHAKGVRTTVVSASPSVAVQVVAGPLGFAEHHIFGGDAAAASDTLLPQMASPLPYGETKAALGRGQLAGRRWLASFGDSPFDAPMMRAAELAVLVRPKPALESAILGHPQLAVLVT